MPSAARTSSGAHTSPLRAHAGRESSRGGPATQPAYSCALLLVPPRHPVPAANQRPPSTTTLGSASGCSQKSGRGGKAPTSADAEAGARADTQRAPGRPPSPRGAREARRWSRLAPPRDGPHGRGKATSGLVRRPVSAPKPLLRVGVRSRTPAGSPPLRLRPAESRATDAAQCPRSADRPRGVDDPVRPLGGSSRTRASTGGEHHEVGAARARGRGSSAGRLAASWCRAPALLVLGAFTSTLARVGSRRRCARSEPPFGRRASVCRRSRRWLRAGPAVGGRHRHADASPVPTPGASRRSPTPRSAPPAPPVRRPSATP